MELIIKKTREYFKMQYGQKIKDPYYFEYVLDFKYNNKENKVFISNRALKHFVEERKSSFIKNHTDIYAIEMIESILNNINHVFINPDNIDIKSHQKRDFTIQRIVIYKNMSNYDLKGLKIVADILNERMEIVSIHICKIKKDKSEK